MGEDLRSTLNGASTVSDDFSFQDVIIAAIVPAPVIGRYKFFFLLQTTFFSFKQHQRSPLSSQVPPTVAPSGSSQRNGPIGEDDKCNNSMKTTFSLSREKGAVTSKFASSGTKSLSGGQNSSRCDSLLAGWPSFFFLFICQLRNTGGRRAETAGWLRVRLGWIERGGARLLLVGLLGFLLLGLLFGSSSSGGFLSLLCRSGKKKRHCECR